MSGIKFRASGTEGPNWCGICTQLTELVSSGAALGGGWAPVGLGWVVAGWDPTAHSLAPNLVVLSTGTSEC